MSRKLTYLDTPYFCDGCGEPIKLKDLESGAAKRNLFVPESAHTPEIWENLCSVCLEEEE